MEPIVLDQCIPSLTWFSHKGERILEKRRNAIKVKVLRLLKLDIFQRLMSQKRFMTIVHWNLSLIAMVILFFKSNKRNKLGKGNFFPGTSEITFTIEVAYRKHVLFLEWTDLYTISSLYIFVFVLFLYLEVLKSDKFMKTIIRNVFLSSSQ